MGGRGGGVDGGARQSGHVVFFVAWMGERDNRDTSFVDDPRREVGVWWQSEVDENEMGPAFWKIVGVVIGMDFGDCGWVAAVL